MGLITHLIDNNYLYIILKDDCIVLRNKKAAFKCTIY